MDWEGSAASVGAEDFPLGDYVMGEREILYFIGKVVAYGGGGAAIAFIFFRFLGEKWIEGKFAERLASYKHAQARELEGVKFRINSIFNRVTKLHDKEFEILPEIWGKLNDARDAVLRCVYQFREHPDLNRLSDDELAGFLKNREFSEQQIESVRESQDKNKGYGDVVAWREICEAQQAINDFLSVLTRNRIFLMSDLREKFDSIDRHMRAIWASNKVGMQCKDQRMGLESFTQHDEPIKSLMHEIEELVSQRLNPSEPFMFQGDDKK